MNLLIFRSIKPMTFNLLKQNRILCNPRYLNHQCRALCSKTETFDTIYVFPPIKIVAPICHLSKHAAIISLVTTPAVGGLEFVANAAPEGLTASFLVAGLVFNTLTLILGQLFHKTIGFIYVSDDSKKIKVAYVTRWGKRMETVIPTEDWIPLSELPATATSKIYLTTQRYSTKGDRYKLYYDHGMILNEQLAKETIGSP